MKVKLVNPVYKSNYGRSLLQDRGITDVETFLNPTEDCLQSYWDLDNMSKGLSLIANLRNTSKVALVVDCDIDGYTSSAILYQYLRRLHPEISIDVFLHDGKAHGLEEHWKLIAPVAYDLVIVPDAGSNDAEYASQIECPILVLDHHLTDITPSPNMTVINNQLSPRYKNKDLSGAGVVFQFCRALDEKYGNNWAWDYVDLAAVGICGDMMSGLEVENQYLWRRGFHHLNNYFLLSLARKQAYSITGKMGATDLDIFGALDPTSVAFYIVPLVNAMIRVGTDEEKQRMWLAFVNGHMLVPSQKRGAKGTSEEVAIESARECGNARTHQNKFKDNAVAQLEQKIFKYDLLENKILFVRLDDEEFPPELTGLIAMQLSKQFKRPTIVARLNDEGYIRGSIRGLDNCEIKSFKKFLEGTGLFEYVQGHDNAAGCSIANKDLARFHEIANESLANVNFDEDIYEVEFERQSYDPDLADLILDLAQYRHIWSQQCNEPLIYIKDLHFSRDDIQVMGKNKDTLKIMKNGIAYMKFFAKDLIEEFSQYDQIRVEVVGRANLNEWGGKQTPQIFIEAIQVFEDKKTDF